MVLTLDGRTDNPRQRGSVAATSSIRAFASGSPMVIRTPSPGSPTAYGLTISPAVPDTQANFVWLPAGPRTAEYAAAFGTAGLMVRPYAVGEPGDGVRITIGEPEANARMLEVAATLPR